MSVAPRSMPPRLISINSLFLKFSVTEELKLGNCLLSTQKRH